ncbi:MAG: hypothetical protein ABWZ42_04510, partial [Ilumatobacteraceae bacterium]
MPAGRGFGVPYGTVTYGAGGVVSVGDGSGTGCVGTGSGTGTGAGAGAGFVLVGGVTGVNDLSDSA